MREQLRKPIRVASAVLVGGAMLAVGWSVGGPQSGQQGESLAGQVDPDIRFVDVWTDHGDSLRCYLWRDISLFCERLDRPDD